MPLKLDKMLPRRAAILSKQVSSEMGPAKAFVVFKEEASVAAALALNMKEVHCFLHMMEAFCKSRKMVHVDLGRKGRSPVCFVKLMEKQALHMPALGLRVFSIRIISSFGCR